MLIVGAGFGGIGTAIELKRAGFTEFTILESAAEPGGVWRDNTYPGAACDIPSPLYSFSFEPNPRWPKRFSHQPDILAYLRRVIAKYGLEPHIRYRTEVTGAAFDEARGLWRVETRGGETFEATVFVPAVGQLSRPALPDIPNRESFAGDAFHSARWDHDVDLTGKRVAVIGTGASAVQFVPELRKRAQHVTVFQRTPPYVMAKSDPSYRRWQHWLFEHLPPTQLLGRLRIFLLAEYATYAMTATRCWRRCSSCGPPSCAAATSRIRSCGPNSSPPTRWAASGSSSPTSTCPPSPSRTSTSRRGGSARSPRRACGSRTGRSSRRTSWSTAPVSRRRSSSAGCRCAASAGGRCRTSGPAARGRTWA
ncbi:putative monooxygenase [Amycolatopsis mediterranei S699]|uniref:Monooxygenase n=1 Tax=Amycolatopsis mediterranei (strain S699) TaxID=713604 RepID=A0A9R0NT00_AMYMS|nr:putative monooxygenase [Amycolatopsis mediterranei S699]